jgi:hypothetical protein
MTSFVGKEKLLIFGLYTRANKSWEGKLPVCTRLYVFMNN